MLIEFILDPRFECFGLFRPHLRVESQKLILRIADEDVGVAHVVLQMVAHKGAIWMALIFRDGPSSHRLAHTNEDLHFHSNLRYSSF